MAYTLQQLKTELTTDPTGIGYAALQAQGLGAVATAINLPRASIQVKRADISPSEVFHALDLTDLVTNPGATTNSYLECLLTAPYPLRLQNDDGTDTPVKANVVSILKSGASGTKTRLLALQTRDGSRAEQLWGTNTTVPVLDIQNAYLL